MSEHRPEPPTGEGLSPKGYLLAALFFSFAAVVMFFYLAHQEATGEGFSGHAAVVLLYQLGGKWLVSGFSAVLATGFLLVAIRGMLKSRGHG